ncbi:MAG: class I SAM-dependent methyltransferase [Bryobacteraceae bacterium]
MLATISPPETAVTCWCGQSSWTVSATGRGFKVLHCAACGSYKNDPPPVEPSDIKAHYDAYYVDRLATTKPLPNPATAKHSPFWIVADRFQELYKPGNRAIDLGCGNGHLCAELKARGWKWVAGVDVATPRVERARINYPDIPFYDCYLQDSDIEPGSLDLISMDAVVEHFTDPVGAVKGIANYLAPNGRVVMTTPNMDSGSFRFLKGRWTGMLCPHGHVFLYGKQAIANLVEAAGLIVDKVGSYPYAMSKPGEYWKRAMSGDVKGTVWRAHQDIGKAYGNMIGEGDALFVVARRP